MGRTAVSCARQSGLEDAIGFRELSGNDTRYGFTMPQVSGGQGFPGAATFRNGRPQRPV